MVKRFLFCLRTKERLRGSEFIRAGKGECNGSYAGWTLPSQRQGRSTYLGADVATRSEQYEMTFGMSVIHWLLDRMTLKATDQPIAIGEASQHWLENAGERIACYEWDFRQGKEPELLVVKFVGAAGRAENASPHPLDVWNDVPGIVVVANPPGFGNSPGSPRLATLVDWATATVDWTLHRWPNAPVLLHGISLGGAVAICVARRRPKQVRGIVVRDAPQLTGVIWQRFAWKTGFLPARWAVRNVPSSLDVEAAGAECNQPAVFVHSTQDRIVPPRVQRQVIDAYAGQKRVIHLAQAGHYDPMLPQEVRQYHDALQWLKPQLFEKPHASDTLPSGIAPTEK